MINKYSFLLLVGISMISAQEANTLPNAPTNDEAKEYEMKKAALVKRRLILTEQWLEERIPLAKFITNEGKIFAENVLKDLNALSVEHPDIFKEHTKRFSQFVQKVNDHIDPIRLTADFINIVDGYRTDAEENPSADDLIVIGLLQKHGMDQFETVVAEPMNAFLDKIHKQLTQFWSTLNAQEKTMDSGFGNPESFNEFRKEPVLMQLFELYK